jgi:lysophospholipase L1-like esterase
MPGGERGPAKDRAALASFAALAALILPLLAFPEGRGRDDRPIWERAARRLRKDVVAADAADQMMAGYYENLFDHSSQTLATNRLLATRFGMGWRRHGGAGAPHSTERVPGFLRFRLTPSIESRELDARVSINTLGLADRECSMKKPKGVRRIGVFGDSVVQGLGANAGKNFESLLEDSLNAMRPAGDDMAYELINFGVRGYRVTQIVYVVDEIAPAFEPDVYVVVCSDLTVFRKWGDHVGELVRAGVDLHYPFLRQLAQRARLRADDDALTVDAKLAPHRVETLRWAVETMRRRARDEGAELVIALVPTVSEEEELRDRFAGIADLLAEMQVPCIDVLDTFAEIDDLEPYRISPENHHPNDVAHELLARRLLARLRDDPRAWEVVAGVPPSL